MDVTFCHTNTLFKQPVTMFVRNEKDIMYTQCKQKWINTRNEVKTIQLKISIAIIELVSSISQHWDQHALMHTNAASVCNAIKLVLVRVRCVVYYSLFKPKRLLKISKAVVQGFFLKRCNENNYNSKCPFIFILCF